VKHTRCDKVQCIVTIDGPAGAGKSTVARRLAELLGFDFLDTGAMYRCVTLAALRNGIAPEDQDAVLAVAKGLEITLQGLRVHMNGEDVSEAIRTPEVSRAIGSIADNQPVRALLTSLQHQCAEDRRVVTEGRDQGTVAFPNAPCKIFLIASREERARRRVEELMAKNIRVGYEEILAQQDQRDAEDARRPLGALRKAEDAEEVCTDGMSLDEVVERLKQIVIRKIGTHMPSIHSESRQSKQITPSN
jgi:CMP/dCMP kinase